MITKHYDDPILNAIVAGQAFSPYDVHDCALLCHLAYEKDISVTVNATRGHFSSWLDFRFIPLDTPELFSSSEVKVNVGFMCADFVGEHLMKVVIVIRGSTRFEDWIANLLFFRNAQNIHYGFSIWTDRIWPILRKFMDKYYTEEAEILITGHSLGGAAAILIADRLYTSGFGRSKNKYGEWGTTTITFGAPRVSSIPFSLNTPLCRIRTGADFVPYLPPRVFNFSDFENEYILTTFDPGYRDNNPQPYYALHGTEKGWLRRFLLGTEAVKVLATRPLDVFAHEHLILRYVERNRGNTSIDGVYERWLSAKLREYERIKGRAFKIINL
jgi:Lipase (class 3)